MPAHLHFRLADSFPFLLRATIALGLVLGYSSLGRSQEAPSSSRSAGTDALRDITGIEEAPLTPVRPWWPYGLAIAIAMTASLLLAGWKYYRASLGENKETPGAWALTEMRRIDSLHLPDSGQVEQFHRLYSEVIRQYLEKRFHLGASRQTTPEFLQTMGASPHLTPLQRTALKDFLERCDLAKFAQVQFPMEECRSLSQSAQSFVIQTSSDSPTTL
ncbi:MAG TPA: hypothetical protein VGX70_13020 [Gemmataceae bacterium]|jgi:hypothetical protein|nr:hypothetical protein [Gemmataceae bacterium]